MGTELIREQLKRHFRSVTLETGHYERKAADLATNNPVLDLRLLVYDSVRSTLRDCIDSKDEEFNLVGYVTLLTKNLNYTDKHLGKFHTGIVRETFKEIHDNFYKHVPAASGLRPA